MSNRTQYTPFHPTLFTESNELVLRALRELKEGKPIIVTDHQDREDEGDLVAAVENLTPQTVNFMASTARGLICTPISEKLAAHFDLTPMAPVNSCHHQTAFTISIDWTEGTSTGISAFDRCLTMKRLLDPRATAKDFRRPGHVFPLVAKNGGLFEREGHTEAAIELVRLAGFQDAAVICEIMGDNGEMLRGKQLLDFSTQHQLVQISISQIKNYLRSIPSFLKYFDAAELPTAYGSFQIMPFTDRELGGAQLDSFTHFVLFKNLNHQQTPLVRIHSECLTGDILSSLRCDCGFQLQESMRLLSLHTGPAILIYLRQEGRGIGLVEKLKAYNLQDTGLDTIEANLKLGHPIDDRHFHQAALVLKHLQIEKLEILTNNPDKVTTLKSHGLVVTQVPLPQAPINDFNKHYLHTKKEKMGHFHDNNCHHHQ